MPPIRESRIDAAVAGGAAARRRRPRVSDRGRPTRGPRLELPRVALRRVGYAGAACPARSDRRVGGALVPHGAAPRRRRRR